MLGAGSYLTAPARLRRIGALVLAIMSVLGDGIAVAQQPRPVEFPPAPDPTECVVSPIGEETLQLLAVEIPATPLATPAEPTSALSLFPNSESVGSSARQEIEALQQQFVACLNAGDFRRLASMFTQSYLARIVAAAGEPITELLPPDPEPLDALDWESAVVSDVRRADDGRLVALVHRCGFDEIVYYRRDERGWRIDDAIRVPVEGVVICGTVPVPTQTPSP